MESTVATHVANAFVDESTKLFNKLIGDIAIPAIIAYLSKEKGVEVTAEELMEGALGIPYVPRVGSASRPGPSVGKAPLRPPVLPSASGAGAGRSRRKSSETKEEVPLGDGCIYIYKTGKNPNTRCNKQIVSHDYCLACLKKKTAQKAAGLSEEEALEIINANKPSGRATTRSTGNAGTRNAPSLGRRPPSSAGAASRLAAKKQEEEKQEESVDFEALVLNKEHGIIRFTGNNYLAQMVGESAKCFAKGITETDEYVELTEEDLSDISTLGLEADVGLFGLVDELGLKPSTPVEDTEEAEGAEEEPVDPVKPAPLQARKAPGLPTFPGMKKK